MFECGEKEKSLFCIILLLIFLLFLSDKKKSDFNLGLGDKLIL